MNTHWYAIALVTSLLVALDVFVYDCFMTQQKKANPTPAPQIKRRTRQMSKRVEELTSDEINEAFCVIMDSHKQQYLMDNPESPNSWMLDFVHDSCMQEQLRVVSNANATISSALTFIESNGFAVVGEPIIKLVELDDFDGHQYGYDVVIKINADQQTVAKLHYDFIKLMFDTCPNLITFNGSVINFLSTL